MQNELPVAQRLTKVTEQLHLRQRGRFEFGAISKHRDVFASSLVHGKSSPPNKVVEFGAVGRCAGNSGMSIDREVESVRRNRSSKSPDGEFRLCLGSLLALQLTQQE